MKDLFELLALFRICFTKENAVISKEQVGDIRTTSTNGDAREEVVPNSLMNNSRETLGTKEEETRRKGVSLSKTFRRSDVSKGNPIYED